MTDLVVNSVQFKTWFNYYDVIDSVCDKHYVNVNSNDSGIFELCKMRTTNCVIGGKNYMLKSCTEEQCDIEMFYYNKLLGKVNMPKHWKIKVGQGFCLLRGPVTQFSLGDYVYKYFMGKEPILVDKGDGLSVIQSRKFAVDTFVDECFDNLNLLFVNQELLEGYISLDNVDCNGLLYDFDDFGKGVKPNLNIMLADFCMYYSQFNLEPNKYFSFWFPKDYDNLLHGSWCDKVLALNNNILNASSKATELFIDVDSSLTYGYFNELFGFMEVDHKKISDCEQALQYLYYMQDPAIRSLKPVECISSTISCVKDGDLKNDQCKPVYYNLEAYEDLVKRGVDCDACLKYGYFQGSASDVLSDFNYYVYQGNLFMQPHILKFLYKRVLKDFSVVMTSERYSYYDCKPNKSSLGPSHEILRALKQDEVYGVLSMEVIEDLVKLAQETPLMFTTKVSAKFALTAKARARTIAACSMFASTLFRACHKPVTANIVNKSQSADLHSLIGVSKFYGNFDSYIKRRYGSLDNFKVFGSDYTKCDRSFPLVFRGLAAAVLYELGCWDSDNYLFINELQAFMLDFVLVGDAVYQKSGGTSSGDATTAFANTIYNHVVHLYVQLVTLVTEPVGIDQSVLKAAAVKLWQTGDSDVYDLLLDEVNGFDYCFNFLSDDSFILTRRDDGLLDIFNCVNFSRRLETLLHTKVDVTKAWQSDGIHEFCSSEIKQVDGVYQYVPDKNRILAAMLITGKAVDSDLELVRLSALLSESVIFSKLDPKFWDAIFGHFYYKYNDYLAKYGSCPLPERLVDENFYKSLVFSNVRDNYDFFQSYVGNFELQASEVKTCYCCSNITVATCVSCPVEYSLCASCAYLHFCESGHLVTHLAKCMFSGCCENDPSIMNYCVTATDIKTFCNVHKVGLSLPTLDHVNRLLRIPYANNCVYQNDNVLALSVVIENIKDLDFFFWDDDKTVMFNKIRLLHDSYLVSQYNSDNELDCVYEVVDSSKNLVKILTVKGCDPLYGFTTYCNIKDDNGRIMLRCTVDPVGNGVYLLTFVDNGIKFMRFKNIVRVSHELSMLKLSSFNYFDNVEFILGPPGTGKTTYFKNNYFNSNFGNRIVYCAPTHKLVQDMDKSLGLDSNVSIIVSKHNNRNYINVLNDMSCNIFLGTINVLRPMVGCVLLIDECSLLTPSQLLSAIVRVQPSKVIIVGDPFQLAPVLPKVDFCWDYKNFYICKLVKSSNIKVLDCCYRCPSNIFNSFAKVYYDSNISIYPYRQGGIFELVRADFRLNKDCIDVKIIDKLASQVDVILCNYKAAVLYGVSKGYNIMTIDSAQGITVSNVGVCLFGHTNFTRVLNRLIVAFSRATDSLIVYCDNYMYDYISSKMVVDINCGVDLPVSLQTNLNASLEIVNNDIFNFVDLDYCVNNVASLAVCDIEFYHVKYHDFKNFLGIGEVSLLTSRNFTTYLRPRYMKNFIDVEVLNKNIFVPKPWRYMMKFLPSRAVSDCNLNKLIHFIVETCDYDVSNVVFVLFNGRHDLSALRQICVKACRCTFCNDKAIVANDVYNYCYKHYDSSVKLKYLVNPCVYNISGSSALAVEHSLICDVNHGVVHSSSVDCVLTGCLLSSMLKNKVDVYKYEGSWCKCNYSVYDKFNRLYGDVLYYKNSRVDIVYMPVSRTCEIPSVHNSDYVIRPAMVPYGCHPSSNIHVCTMCVQHFKEFYYIQLEYLKMGFEYRGTCSLQALTKVDLDYKLDCEVFLVDGVTYVRSRGKVLKYYNSLDDTIKRFKFIGNYSLPSRSVLYGLGVTCTVGIIYDGVPLKDVDSLNSFDVVLTYCELSVPNKQVVLCMGNPSSKYVWHSDETASVVLCNNDSVFVNKSGVVSYSFRTVGFEVFTNLWSTGRFVNNDRYLFEGEDVVNRHVDLGEYNNVSYKLGGGHMFPMAFQGDLQFKSLFYKDYDVVYNLQMVGGRGLKCCNSVIDVHVKKFYDYVNMLLTEKLVSLKTVVYIDFQAVPLMLWATEGVVDTVYCQVKDVVDRGFKVNDDYVIWRPYPYNSSVELERPKAYYVPSFRLNQSNNVTKYVQLCKFLGDYVKVNSGSRILDLGASSGESHDYLPVGGIVLEHFYSKCFVDHFDIIEVHGRRNWLGGKYDLIVSDIFVEGDVVVDNYGLCYDYVKKYLKLGGSILWKTTRRNGFKNVIGFSQYFGKFQAFTVRCNMDSTEVYLAFINFKGFDCNVFDYVDYDVLNSIAFVRMNYQFMVRDSVWPIDFSAKYSALIGVSKFLMGKMTPELWGKGRFRCLDC